MLDYAVETIEFELQKNEFIRRNRAHVVMFKMNDSYLRRQLPF